MAPATVPFSHTYLYDKEGQEGRCLEVAHPVPPFDEEGEEGGEEF